MKDGAQFVIKTITAAQLSACPGKVLVPGHYRSDGTCLHEFREGEVVEFHSDVRDDDQREYYSGQDAVLIEAKTFPDETLYMVEFASGSRLVVQATEVRAK